MTKITKIWLIIAVSLILIGCVIFFGVMTMLKWDLTKLSTVKYETNEYEISEAYKNISIVTDTADVVFVPSENESSLVVCREQKNIEHTVLVKDNTLTIEINDTRKWYEFIGINMGSSKITVNVPMGKYGALWVESETGDVEIPKDFKFESIDISENTGRVENYASVSDSIKIKTSTGDICVENISAGSLELSVSTGGIKISGVSCEGEANINVSTGKAKLTDVQCKNLISSGNTGSVNLKNVVAADKISVTRSTGDIEFEACDAAEINIKTSTGYVKGTLLSDKIFSTQTDTGRVRVPKTTSGGICNIKTSTGDIDISIQQ